MNSEKILSIVTPVYNGEKTIKRFVDSLLIIDDVISPGEVQWVVVDDGSNDDTLQVLRKETGRLKNIEFVLESQENKGPGPARNKAIEMSQGKWIYFLDCDDTLNSNIVKVIKDNDDKSTLYFGIDWYRDEKFVRYRAPVNINKDNYMDILSGDNVFNTACLVFKKDNIEHLFHDDIRCLEDWYFFLMNHKIYDNIRVFKNVSMAQIHAHSENTSANYRKMAKYRVMVSSIMLEKFSGKLTRMQNNNFSIQKAIGDKMCGGRISFKALLKVPSSKKLYLKMMVYFFFWPVARFFDIYKGDNN